MPQNDFNNLNLIAVVVAFGFGMWASILNFSKRNLRYLNVKRMALLFVFDMLVSIGFTMLTYLGLVGAGVNELLSVAIAGFTAHQGTRAVWLIEMLISEKLGARDTFNIVSSSNKKDN